MAAEQKKTLPDIFVEGAKKGWNVGISSIIPNVLMAFVLIHALRLSGLLDMLGVLFNPVMGLFGLPGQAVMALVGAWMSMGAGVGVAASLYAAKILNPTQVPNLLPANSLSGAQI